jgi:chemotaxis protein CheD
MKLAELPFSQIYLRPGELLVTQEAKWVVTILGSCVALTMFDRRLRFAGMCHAMLPRPCDNERVFSRDPNRFRFLSHAVPEMLERFRSAGILMDRLEVKMFGGGNVIHLDAATPAAQAIGNANIEEARELLRKAHLPLQAENVGGSVGRKILFNTQTGEVLHKHLSDPYEFGLTAVSSQKPRARHRRKALT